MIIEHRKQQNLGPVVVILLMAILLLYISAITVDSPLEGVSGGHGNHVDNLITPLPGNTCPSPGCTWPDCGCAGKNPQLTLEPTPFITALATFPNPATPDIPDPVSNATVFPTLAVDPLPTAINTMAPPQLMPTFTPPPIPTTTPGFVVPL